ncbi:MAG: DNA-deoxyinosine glycosylase [Campylobacterota bacterium]|nr:DNA-deoxyinosine glycosylase [Campylobacterota bacterium]
MSSKELEHPFDPIIFNDTEILILGSFPSVKSFENNFYYAHPQNQFWKILSAVTGYPANTRDQRIWLLKEAKLGLWDMIRLCRRESSLDSSLMDEEVNDIAAFLEEHSTIRKVAFTGRKSEALFDLNFGYLEIERVYLPSPSSAYAKMNIQDKILLYCEKLEIGN